VAELFKDNRIYAVVVSFQLSRTAINEREDSEIAKGELSFSILGFDKLYESLRSLSSPAAIT